MNSMLMPPSTTEEAVLVPDQNGSESNKYITFKLANYLFALPSNKILKVVPTPTPSQGGMVSMGLVQLEQYSIQTLDLPKMMNLQPAGASVDLDNGSVSDKTRDVSKLSEPENEPKRGSLDQEKNPPFLMVLQDTEGVLWGIAVNEPPDLMDIPDYALKPVPSEKRLTRTLRWVSHVVTFDLDSARHTLLVLDLSVLLSTQPTPSPSEGSLLLEIEPPIANASLAAGEEESSGMLLGIEPPLELAELEVLPESGRQEEMYA